MYRLMKSEKQMVEQLGSRAMSSYLHTQLDEFPELDAALSACQTANEKAGCRHYVLDSLGKEYYHGTWID